MVLSRSNRTPRDELRATLQSLTDVGRSLQVARELSGAIIADAAARAGLERADVVALESGRVDYLPNRIETLRKLQTYAESLGLPGDEYVLATISLWPAITGSVTARADAGLSPVVSVTAAPAGGHAPSSSAGSAWPGDNTGVPDAGITGVVEQVIPRSISDTGRVPVYDTGKVKLARPSAPLLLKVTVALVAVLVAVGGLALAEHSHVSGWYHRATADSGHWFDNAKVALDIDRRPAAHPARVVAPPLPKVTYVNDPATNSVVITVGAPRFSVKMVAFGYPVWLKVTAIFQPVPLYERVLPGGSSHTFGVNSSISIESASAAGRAYLYEGTRFIGFYFPSHTPFTMTFNATT
jgi:hypothetical protein